MASEEKRWGSSRSPFSDWGRWEEEMGKKFDDLLDRGRRWWPSGSGSLSSPPVEVYEAGDEMVVRVELPGMDKTDFEANLSGSTLTIKGEKKRPHQELEEKDYSRSEISYGTFTRIIDLPLEVQPDTARASLDKGVLEVRLPKTESAKKKSTKIDIA
ncbi:MAG: Hsp20/alpha crystallin family protein [Candidatus Binatia bacterium]